MYQFCCMSFYSTFHVQNQFQLVKTLNEFIIYKMVYLKLGSTSFLTRTLSSRAQYLEKCA